MQQVKQFWDSTTEQLQTELLTLDIDCLNKQAARLPDQKRVAKVLAEGIRHLAQTGTWKQWQWDASSKLHTTAASFRDWVVQQRVPHALQSLLQQAQDSTASTQALHKLHTKLQRQSKLSGVPKTSAFMEMFNMDILTSLHDPDQRATFSQDVTTDADKFEKILTPLEHRINKVLIKQQDEAEAANQKHKAQFDHKVNAWGLQVDSLKQDMKEGILHVGSLVRTGQTPETSPEMRATIDELDILGVKFKEEFWPKLCSPGRAQSVLNAMQTQQQQLAQDSEAGCVELSLLEAHVVIPACDDPGALLLPHLILPYLRKRLEAQAAQFCAKTDAGSASHGRALYNMSIKLEVLQDVECVTSRLAQMYEEAEDASMQACIQFYRD